MERQARRKYSLLEKPIVRKRADSSKVEGQMVGMAGGRKTGKKAAMKGLERNAADGEPERDRRRRT